MKSIAAPLIACSLALATTGSAQVTNGSVDVNGVARTYLIYTPAGYDGTTDLPALFVYHGGSMTAQSMLALIDFRPLADANDFLLVYTQGLPDDAGDPIWNSEGPFSNGVDEIGYTSAVIDDVDAGFALDLDRVYVTGYSNGANMVWELGCLLSNRIAAGGAVAGSMWTWTEDLCAPTRPYPLLSIHGTNDFYNPYNGGLPFSLGLIDACESWVTSNNGDLTPTIVDVPNTVPNDGSTVEHYTWGGGDDCVSVEHYKVQNGGHDWPGVFGNMDIDSNQLIWDFVSQYSLDGLIPCTDCSVVKLGVGVGGANVGNLDLAADPTLGSTLQFDLDGFTGAGNGLLFLSLESLTFPALGGTIYVDITQPAVVLALATAADGTASASTLLPNDPTLLGLMGYGQAAVRDTSQSQGWAFSNGLEMTFCM